MMVKVSVAFTARQWKRAVLSIITVRVIKSYIGIIIVIIIVYVYGLKEQP